MRLLAILLSLTVFAAAADRPNIVWIVSEDNSIHYLRHFFPGGAETPAIEALAAHGLTFDNAFSNAPVCSVARTTLATMCYGPRIGTQFHRRYKSPPLPDGVRMFPEYLRKAGYYTSNNSKTDYNAEAGKEVWDESSNKASWRNRSDAKQPFFHMQSHAQSHESSLHFNQQTYENVKTNHDPAKVQPGAHLPDTPLFRYTHARYLDNQQIIDGIVAETVANLEKDGLLEDTFIFYFGDHGGVLPRGKGYVYDTGLHVPLVVRVPENFKHLVEGADFGARVPGFVQFIDFGATTLQLAGVPLPQGIDGKAFLGQGISIKEVNQRDEAFGYANRMDEKYDFVRTLRKGKYQYIRSFEPWLPDGLHNNYRYKMLAYEEWRQLWKDGKLTGAPALFFEPKPVEMLFDCEADPWTVKNLANDPAHAATLQELRGRLQQQMRSMPDLSYYPESYLAANAMDNPVAFGQKHLDEIKQLADTADLMLVPFDEAKPGIEAALKSDVPMQRYLGAMVCTAFGKQAALLADLARPLLDDSSEIVRVRALEFLGSIGEMNPQPALTALVNQTSDPVLAVEALNSVVWFKDHFDGKYPVQRSDFHPAKNGGDIDDRLNYINGVPYPSGGKAKKKGKK
ncbi:MAG: sulfatase-like hydrolase/transferase [Prosthecobacter sp.]